MKRQIAAILTATVIPLVSCSGTPQANPDTETAAPTAASSTATSPETSPVDAPETDIYDDIPVSIPDTITGADREAAEQAAAVWRAAMRVFDESLQDPTTHNWQPDVYKYANDPAALTQMSLIDTFEEQQLVQVGPTQFRADVFEASPHSVKIRACLDFTRYDVIDTDGDSVTMSDGPDRIRRDYWIGFYEEPDVWYLNFVDMPDPTEPC